MSTQNKNVSAADEMLTNAEHEAIQLMVKLFQMALNHEIEMDVARKYCASVASHTESPKVKHNAECFIEVADRIISPAN